jgi:ATP synthase protein I
MTPRQDEQVESDPLVRGARLRNERHQNWLRDGGRSVMARLAQIGVLGWMIVVPILIGIFAGRWLDRQFHSGLFWTAPLLLLGALLGCWSAWKWMQAP